MSNIQQILASILNAIYGKDVRQAIHDGVEIAYNKADDAETSAAAAAEAASGSQESAAASAEAAAASASSASGFADQAEQYKNEAFHTTPAGYEAFVGEVNSSLKYAFESGVKNIFKLERTGSSDVLGITYTFNNDGSITLNGTATAWNSINLNYQANVSKFPAGEYIVSGGVTGCGIRVVINGSNDVIDFGSGKTFTVPANPTQSHLKLEVQNGSSFDHLTIYPMVRSSSIQDATWQPYAQTNVALTENIEQVNSSLDYLFTDGVKNLYPPVASLSSVGGITPTINADGTISTSGTTTSENIFHLSTISFTEDTPIKISGCPSGLNQNAYLQFNDKTTGSNVSYDRGSGGTYTCIANHEYELRIYFKNNVNLSGLVWKPMITYANVPNSDYAHYVPYALSNNEITEGMKATDISVTFDEDAGDYLRTDRLTLAQQIVPTIKNGVLYWYFNLDFKSIASQFEITTIATISGLDMVRTYQTLIVPQNGSSKVLILSVKSTGEIQVGAANGSDATFYRTTMAVPLK